MCLKSVVKCSPCTEIHSHGVPPYEKGFGLICSAPPIEKRFARIVCTSIKTEDLFQGSQFVFLLFIALSFQANSGSVISTVQAKSSELTNYNTKQG